MHNNKTVRITAATHPFKAERKSLELPEGLTISQMLAMAQPDQKQVEHARVFVRGELIPKKVWSRYRPKAGILVEVRAFPIPQGGGGDDGGKSVLRIVLTIAVIAFAAWAGSAIAGLLGFAQGTQAFAIASAVGTATAGTAGMLAINAIAPIRPPKMNELSKAEGKTDSPTLFIEGARNQIRPFSPVPMLLGKYRMTPAYGAKPFTEVVGDKQFVRMLFVWGIGPISIDLDSLKIGDTLLSEFTGYQIEHREGYDSDDPLTLYPDTVDEDTFNAILTQTGSWVTRTSGDNADELNIEVTFPQGLVEYDERGNREARQVTIEIEYQLSGSSGWEKIDTSNAKFQTTAADSWLSKSGSDLNSITFNQNRTSTIRHGIRWGVSTRGQYDIRIRRTTSDQDSTQIFDKVYFTNLRTITDTDPINSPVPIAKTALVIQATDQLNNIIDEFNGLCTTVALDWDSGTETWIEQTTQNPASLFRHVLQGNGIYEPLADSRIDLDTLQEWHEFCDAKGFKFNMVRDFSSSIWETLADIAAAGRAAPTQIDGKWSVVIEKERTVPVSHITPRNSFDFKAQKFFVNQPHGWRISFVNEDEDYRMDERRVYRDGYDENNATFFESLELIGVTDPNQIYKLGRFRIAQGINQPERWSFKQDMEYLTYQRGDRVAITHDVLLVGLAYGRVKDVILSGSDVTGIELDEEVTMEAGNDYGISIRTINGQITRQVVLSVGSTTTLTLSTSIPGVGSPAVASVSAGNIFGFGILGQESDDASILSIQPDTNFKAQITAVPYRSAIFDVDSEAIPAFTTNLTPLTSIPTPNIREVVSDESAIALGPGDTLKVRIGISFDPMDEEVFGVEPQLRVQIRPSGTNEPFIYPTIDSEEPDSVFISGVRTGETWDIRLRFVIPNKLPGAWAYVYNHQVVGKSTPPSALSNMTISAFGAHALIRWDRPPEIDVQFGGEVVFRHSPALTGATWSESVTIGQSARARTLFAALPLKEGTYMARVFDVAGTPSNEVTMVTTKQASVHAFTSVDTLDEATSFLGTHTNTTIDSGKLKIDEAVSPAVLSAQYEFAQGIDLGAVTRVRVTTRVDVTTYNISTNIDSRLDNIDDWEDFDGDTAAGADARVYVRQTDDDPTGSPVTWGEWERLDSAEFECWGLEFYVELTRESEDYNILIEELGVDVESVT